MNNRLDRPARLLVADDSLTVRMALAKLFGHEGYEVTLAENGSQALEQLEHSSVDVFILDLVMDGLSGVDVLRAIRTDEVLGKVPVLLLTAVADRKELVECLDLGADDFIVKPWDERELLGRVRSLVRLKFALDEARTNIARTAALLNAPQQLAILVDRDTNVLAGNLSRLSDGAAAASPRTMLDVLGRAQWEQCRHVLREVFASASQKQLETTDGERVWEVGIYPVRDDPARVEECAVIARDITEKKRAERRLAELNAQLVEASRQAGMADVATGILHNVGNVLNSINVTVNLIRRQTEESRARAMLPRLQQLLGEHHDDLSEFIRNDPRGRHFPEFLGSLLSETAAELDGIGEQIAKLARAVEHVNQIVASQHQHAKNVLVIQQVNLPDLIDHAIQTAAAGSPDHLTIERDLQGPDEITTDKHLLLQILINLVKNAIQAVEEAGDIQGHIVVKTEAIDEQHLDIVVMDNGVGIEPDDLERIFQHGCTRRRGGQGLGLHTSALAAHRMGGSIRAVSAGPNQGASIQLRLPVTLHAENADDREGTAAPARLCTAAV